jgi:hypothetical protein
LEENFEDGTGISFQNPEENKFFLVVKTTFQ